MTFDFHKIRDDTIAVFRLKQGGSFYAQFWIKPKEGKGRQVMKSLGTKSDNECDTLANDLYVKLTTTSELGGQVTKLTFSKLWDEFIKHQKKKVDAKLASQHVYATMLYSEKFLVPHFGKMLPPNITESDIDDFKIWRRTSIQGLPGRKGKVSAKTINMHVQHLKQCFHYAKNHKRIQLNLDPRDIKGVKRVDVKRPAFTSEQFAYLCEKLENDLEEAAPKSDERYYAALLYYFVRILTATGMRPGELQHLKWSNISIKKDDQKRNVVIFHVEKSKTQETNGKRDVVGKLVTHNVIKAWKKYARYTAPTDYIFPNILGKKAGMLDDMFVRRLKRFHLTHTSDGRAFTLYSLRHTYATLSLRYSKISAFLMAKNMGTSVTQIERHYGQVATTDVATLLAGTGMSWGDKKAVELVGD